MVCPQRAFDRVQGDQSGRRLAESAGVEGHQQLLGDHKGVEILRPIFGRLLYRAQLALPIVGDSLFDRRDELNGLGVLRQLGGQPPLNPGAGIKLGQGGEHAAGIRCARVAPLEAGVLLDTGLQRGPAYRLIRPAQRPRRVFPGGDDDRADGVAHRITGQPRCDLPGPASGWLCAQRRLI